jgi:hypothetical protein
MGWMPFDDLVAEPFALTQHHRFDDVTLAKSKGFAMILRGLRHGYKPGGAERLYGTLSGS